jgi:hypothetical protein
MGSSAFRVGLVAEIGAGNPLPHPNRATARLQLMEIHILAALPTLCGLREKRRA